MVKISHIFRQHWVNTLLYHDRTRPASVATRRHTGACDIPYEYELMFALLGPCTSDWYHQAEILAWKKLAGCLLRYSAVIS